MTKVEMEKLIEIIRDFAFDIEIETTCVLVDEDKRKPLSKIRKDCEAILDYVAELEKVGRVNNNETY